MRTGTVLLTTASGQYSQHRKQAGLFLRTGVHLASSMTGRESRHSPVFPASPMPGDDSPQMCPHSRVPTAPDYGLLSISVVL